MRSILTFALVAVVGLAGLVTSAFAQQKPPARGIVNITGHSTARKTTTTTRCSW